MPPGCWGPKTASARSAQAWMPTCYWWTAIRSRRFPPPSAFLWWFSKESVSAAPACSTRSKRRANPSAISLTKKAESAMSRKILIVTGDGGDSYETLYACQRFLEAQWTPVIAAPSRRRLHMVLHDSQPGWQTYGERAGHSAEGHLAITAPARRDLAPLP